MYTVLEISQKLGTSKATIYRKLESIGGVSEHVSIKNNTKYIDDIGFKLIEKTLENKSCSKDVSEEKYAELLEKNNKYIAILEEEIEYLREEIQLKNNLIAEQSRQLGNNQLLLLESKKKILMLETNALLEKDNKPKVFRFPKGLSIFKRIFGNKQCSN